jgi:ubiquinone biosynthesis O-methyltransferase
MNPLRHDFIQRCKDTRIQEEDKKLRIMDIGCGGGIFAESAARLSSTANVTAIDPTPEVIAIARKHARADPKLMEDGRLTYLNTAIENLPLPSSPEAGYDIITVFEVIEHIQQPVPFLREVLKHLKPGGWLIGSTIARTGVSWLTTKFVAEEVLRMVPRGTHEWSQYIQPSEMREWAKYEDNVDVGVDGRGWQVMGVVYVPGAGWKEVPGSAEWGNYFFGVRKLGVGESK